MKKYFEKRFVWAFLMVFILCAMTGAVEATQNLRHKSSVILVFNNIAGTRYDDKLSEIALEKLQKKIEGIYIEVGSEPYDENFKARSFEQAALEELKSQVDGCEADYFVYVELQPFTKETDFDLIYFNKAVETGLVLRIVDLKNSSELYSKKYVMKAEDSTDYFFIGSGSVAQKALDAVLFRAGEAISVKLPL